MVIKCIAKLIQNIVKTCEHQIDQKVLLFTVPSLNEEKKKKIDSVATLLTT